MSGFVGRKEVKRRRISRSLKVKDVGSGDEVKVSNIPSFSSSSSSLECGRFSFYTSIDQFLFIYIFFPLFM